MEQTEREHLIQITETYLDENLLRIVVSNPTTKQGVSKVKIRPLMLKGNLIFQAEELAGNQAFHKNFSAVECAQYLAEFLEDQLRQL